MQSGNKKVSLFHEKKSAEGDQETPTRLAQIKQVEAFIWIHDILKVQLQNLDLNNIGPEVDLGNADERHSNEIQENKNPGSLAKLK